MIALIAISFFPLEVTYILTTKKKNITITRMLHEFSLMSYIHNSLVGHPTAEIVIRER